jgi:virginiamycin A acetyltransferase
VKRPLERTVMRACRALVAPSLALYHFERRIFGEERAYLAASGRASRWPGFLGERRRLALYRGLGTQIADYVILRQGCLLQRPPIEIGRGSVIGFYTTLHQARIGRDTLLSDHCSVLDGARQHYFERVDVPIVHQGGEVRRVSVGDDCFVGVGARILADVGDHCVVGAGAVVTKPVPDYKIVAGSPAKVIGDRRELAQRAGGDPVQAG